MKKEISYVPKNVCPLDFLAQLGERTADAWIFFDESVYDNLLNSSGVIVSFRDFESRERHLLWEETEEYPKTEVFLLIPEEGGWGRVKSISAIDIAFDCWRPDPKEIFFLKMEE